ncbi:MAG: efflux RND transporter periplasmic adaptor subunit [Clostridiales Family XIII bacterium]|jgi:multidrug efflux pump subunit AcrA (membrane-fusion protein)|nr:efflux RND transporter periplasmic adaptor subunit [Clostridiales Family XIII bacterium]
MQGKKRTGRIITLSVIAVVVIAAGVIFIPKIANAARGDSSSQQFLTAEAAKGEIISSLSATGSITENEQDVDIFYGVTVSGIAVSAGDTVAKGDAIATLDTSSVTQAITSAKSELADVNDQLDAIADGDTDNVYVYSKLSGTVKDVFVGKGDAAADSVSKNGALLTITLTDGGEFKVTNAEGIIDKVYVKKGGKVYSGTTLLRLKVPGVTVSKDSLDSKKSALIEKIETLTSLQATGVIYAPYAGTIGKLHVSAGSALTNTDGDTDDLGALATIVLPDKMNLSVTIDELDISAVKEGQEASISLDALDGETFAGTVTEASSEADTSGNAPRFTAVISFEKADGMYPGMSATATIIKEKREDVITLPLEALQQSGNEMFVYTAVDADGNLSGATAVETGLSNGASVEITSGLTEGAAVYYVATSNDSSTQFGVMGGGMMIGGGERTFSTGSEGPPSGGGGNGGGQPPAAEGGQ